MQRTVRSLSVFEEGEWRSRPKVRFDRIPHRRNSYGKRAWHKWTGDDKWMSTEPSSTIRHQSTKNVI